MLSVITMANLVIVESPAKAATIKGYLGTNYKVLASSGHIRDLPKSRFGIDIENGFKPDYINIRGKGEIIGRLKKEAKNAGKIFLATDPDREGEAISWHLASVLEIPQNKICRVTFNEITKPAIKEAIKSPRAIDKNLVDAQQARRILDRILGYKLSPFLWKNVKSRLGAGRVQSVAARIIVEREKEIEAFVPSEYWTIEADIAGGKEDALTVRFAGAANGKNKVKNAEEAAKIEAAVSNASFKATEIKTTEKLRHPAPPFTTSTMQQEASRKLGFPLQKIMKLAQELYEGINLGAEHGGVQGLITYMRTDSLRVSKVAQEMALELIAEKMGKEYLPKTPRVYKSKANAQDAHEAIRPANVALTPKAIKKALTNDQYRLYKLIWERFIASQMASAVLSTVSLSFESAGYLFKTGGYTVKFPGFMAVYQAEESSEDREMNRLPDVNEGEVFAVKEFRKEQRFTEAPPRYTEASLIKFLEDNGIGRPSTYAPIISSILKSYVKHEGKTLVPTPLGVVTTQLMVDNFPDFVDYKFTAEMEDELDSIESGAVSMEAVLADIYADFEKSLSNASESVSREQIEIPPDVSSYPCDKCGAMMIYKDGRYGRFLACPNYPKCRSTKAVDKNGKPVEKKKESPEIADFKCEICGGDVVIRSGKYGSFYACVNYPNCTFTKQKTTPIGVKCPDCGSEIISKHSKGKTVFYSCERYPDCNFSSWNLPTNERCPDCDKILYLRKGKKSMLVCGDKECGFRKEIAPSDAADNDVE